MDRPNTMANISIGTYAGIGRCWSMPSRSEPQPHWKTATTTPYAAPTDSRLRIAALTEITRDRNAIVSSTRESSTTARISQIIREPIRSVKSTLPAVVPTRYVELAPSVGSTESRKVLMRSVVFWAWGEVFGTTLITATVPASLTDGCATEATSEVFFSLELALSRSFWVWLWDCFGSLSTTVIGPFWPSPKPWLIRS